MKKVAIIGAGISGLSAANLLKETCDVTVFEKESTPGGLIRCKRIEGSLFHLCGGHVFNSKKTDVLDWFWSQFNKEEEFSKADRNSVIVMGDESKIPYPIENYIYLMNKTIQKSIIEELLTIDKEKRNSINFEEFLLNRFGDTLYRLYFKPYNEKVWKCDLKDVSLSWLEGKLPMPSVNEIFYNNMNHIREKEFVHSQFYYENNDGSQYIADKLAKNLNVIYNAHIEDVELQENGHIKVNDKNFDCLLFCGNIKQLPSLLKNINLSEFTDDINNLSYHGTTSVFCEIDKNPYSWIYLPSPNYHSHRIICTGNFNPSNNAEGKMTGTIEFTDFITEEEIKKNLKIMPYNPKYITHHYNEFTYPIQNTDTRLMINKVKNYLSKYNIYITGRFADWEYYNMDVAVWAAMNTVKFMQ